jgi:HEPN domain-containing protein
MASTESDWIGQGAYDLETARAMFGSGRYLYVLFCCQQAVEKTLKALVVHRTGEFPPRIHSLPRLAQVSGLEPEPTKMTVLAELSAFYIQTRYPGEISAMGGQVTRQTAEAKLRETEEIIVWLESLLK